jgi:hypothetical protein
MITLSGSCFETGGAARGAPATAFALQCGSKGTRCVGMSVGYYHTRLQLATTPAASHGKVSQLASRSIAVDHARKEHNAESAL